MAADDDIYDLTIIGGGPTGLFAAYYAGLRHMRTKIIDALDELGGQLTALYPEKYIYDVAGFPRVIARDLVHSLTAQAMQHHPTICLGETIKDLRVQPGEPFVIESAQFRHHTRTIIICAGAGAFQSRKLLVEGASHWEGNGVYYHVKEKKTFAGKRLLVVGGGDSAIDWVLNLHDTAKEITLAHRRNQFRAHEDNVNKALGLGVNFLTFWEIKSLLSADGKLCGAVLLNNKTQETREIEVDAILVQIGFISSLGAVKTWPIETVGNGIKVDQHMHTSLPGVFAAGDVTAYDGKLKLIATGFGEAATAVNFAKTMVDPSARLFPGHTSEMGPQTLTTVLAGETSL